MDRKLPEETRTQKIMARIKGFFDTLPGIYFWLIPVGIMTFIFSGASIMSLNAILLIYTGNSGAVYQALELVEPVQEDLLLHLTAQGMGAIFFALAAIRGLKELRAISSDIKALEKEKNQEKKDKA